MSHPNKIFVGLFALGLFLSGGLFVSKAQAASFQESKISIPAGQVVVDSYYVEADSVVIEGELKGDLVAAASSIVIKGKVDGSIIAIAQTVTIEGMVSGSVRTVSGTLHLLPAAQIGGDINAIGATLLTDPNSVIGGSLYYVTSEATLKGQVTGTKKELSNAFKPLTRAGLVYSVLLNFLALGLFGVILFSLQSSVITEELWEKTRNHFLAYFLQGLALFVGIAFISGILLATGVGKWVALFLLAAISLTSVLSVVDVAYFLGRLVTLRKKHQERYIISIFLLGLLILIALVNLAFLVIIPLVIFITCFSVRIQEFYFFLRGVPNS